VLKSFRCATKLRHWLASYFKLRIDSGVFLPFCDRNKKVSRNQTDRLAVCYYSCSKDHVQVYNVAPRRLYPGGPETLKDETLVGVYCGDKLPGPQMSEENSNEMRVRLTTNHAVVETGFRAKYEFVEKSPDKRMNLQSSVNYNRNNEYKKARLSRSAAYHSVFANNILVILS